MTLSAGQAKTLRAWTSIPRRVRRAISGLSARDMKRRGGSHGSSIREYAHHLVESNLVASNIVLAALGKPGCTYDWSWVTPDARWMKRLGYDRAPLEPAIRLLETLCPHVAGMARRVPGGMRRSVKLLDAPGARLRRRTLKQVLDDECEHAEHHLQDIADTKRAHGRSRKASGRRGSES